MALPTHRSVRRISEQTRRRKTDVLQIALSRKGLLLEAFCSACGVVKVRCTLATVHARLGVGRSTHQRVVLTRHTLATGHRATVEGPPALNLTPAFGADWRLRAEHFSVGEGGTGLRTAWLCTWLMLCMFVSSFFEEIKMTCPLQSGLLVSSCTIG